MSTSMTVTMPPNATAGEDSSILVIASHDGEVDGRLQIYPGGERVCSEGDENHQVASRKQNKSDLTMLYL